jgi:hypothetical protein
MKITPQMIQEGWTKNDDGVWVAPSEATKKALRERVFLVEAERVLREAKVNLGGHHDEDRGYTPPSKKEIENSLVHGYQRIGLSRPEAIRAVELGNGKARFNKG